MTSLSLIDFCLASAELDAGLPPVSVLFHYPLAPLSAIPDPLIAAHVIRDTLPKPSSWSRLEDEYLKASLGDLTDQQIAATLGRSANSVHLRWSRDLRLTAPTKNPAYLTSREIARLLNIESHISTALIRKGLLPNHPWPGPRLIWRVPREAFFRWAVKPSSWVYFNPDKVDDPHLRRLLDLQAARWGDEWWTIPQVAAYHGLDVRRVLQYIRLGRLSGVHVMNFNGRSPHARWGLWFLLRSEAARPLRIYRRGDPDPRDSYLTSAGAFLFLAASIGLPAFSIAFLLGKKENSIKYFANWIVTRGLAPLIIEKFSLPIDVRADPGNRPNYFTDWHVVAHRFPHLVEVLHRFAEFALTGASPYSPMPSRRQGHPDLRIVRSVFRAWSAWYLGESHPLTRRLSRTSFSRPLLLLAAYRELQSLGVDPLETK